MNIVQLSLYQKSTVVKKLSIYYSKGNLILVEAIMCSITVGIIVRLFELFFTVLLTYTAEGVLESLTNK